MSRSFLTRFAWLSIVAALATIGLKFAAFALTGSIGLLSDAIESFVNLVGGAMALAMLTVAARPADEEHAYGHSKAEYFSSGVEGSLIVLAAASIAYAAVRRLLAPRALEQIGIGLGISMVASVINLVVALLLLKTGRKHHSITLEANAHHLFTDVWTSIGVLAGVGAVALTGWRQLDPIVALLVAANIVRTGVSIVRRSVSGLMDTALSTDEKGVIQNILARYSQDSVQFHALRTRQAGARRFVSLHVLVPGAWTVHQGHQFLENLEGEIRRALPDSTVFTHLESLDDPASWEDIALERVETLPPIPEQKTPPAP